MQRFPGRLTAKTRTSVALLGFLCLAIGVATAGHPPDDVVKPAAGTFALVHARVETVTNGVVDDATVVIRDGVIEAVGTDAVIPEDAEIIDCTGLTLYPGFIDGGTRLGLTEVGSVSETNDYSELGDFRPHMRALSAVNPNSELIKTTRVSGVTTVITAPAGGLFPGTASLINLVGYTPDHIAAGFEGVVLNFPSTARQGRDRRTQKTIDEEAAKAIKRLNEIWEKAELHARVVSERLQSGGPAFAGPVTPEMDALVPFVRGERALLVGVDKATDILAAIEWIGQRNVRAILTGVAEGWRVADEISEADIPCIVGPVLSIPTRDSDRYDKAYANAGLLRRAGVRIAIRTSDAENVRNLPYHAGFAAAYGLGRRAALEAVTIDAARIFGVDNRLGSIEKGKSATLFAVDGDPFEATSTIRHVFIEGYRIPTADRQFHLYEEFLERTPGLKK